MRQEQIPQIHLVRGVDLAEFAYKIHILAGDFLRESEFNLRSLVADAGTDKIVVMGARHALLSDAVSAYLPTAELNRMAVTEEYPGARAFLFHVERKEAGRPYGDVLMTDLGTLRQDIRKNALYPYGVSMEYRDGTEAEVDIEKWEAMGLCEKDALKSWRYLYDPEQIAEWRRCYLERFRQWREQAFPYMEQDLMERLNTEYMLAAENPGTGMYQIPLETAGRMLLNGDCPVYRLLPGGAEELPPVTAVTTGLRYMDYREFAVAAEGLEGLERLARRETARIAGRVSRRRGSEKDTPGQDIGEGRKRRPCLER